ncbi:MAG: hypothetical protein R3E31_21430 [Chloroflexota bacterium]
MGGLWSIHSFTKIAEQDLHLTWRQMKRPLSGINSSGVEAHFRSP